MRLHAIALLLACGATSALGQPDAASLAKPVAVQGLWCGSGPLRDFSLRLVQHEHEVEGELVRGDRVRAIQGTVDGNVVRTQSTKVGALVLERHGDELKVTGGEGPLVMARGQSFRRSAAATCAG